MSTDKEKFDDLFSGELGELVQKYVNILRDEHGACCGSHAIAAVLDNLCVFLAGEVETKELLALSEYFSEQWKDSQRIIPFSSHTVN